MHRKTIWKWRFTLWSTFTVCELENGPVEIVTIYPSKNDIVHSYVSMLTRYLWWSKKNGTYVFFPSQNHRISPEIFHVVIIIVVIIPIIIVVIWWLYDGIITYYIYISGCWCNFTILKKNDGVRQWEGWHPIYSRIWIWNIKFMFETTHQL